MQNHLIAYSTTPRYLNDRWDLKSFTTEEELNAAIGALPPSDGTRQTVAIFGQKDEDDLSSFSSEVRKQLFSFLMPNTPISVITDDPHTLWALLSTRHIGVEKTTDAAPQEDLPLVAEHVKTIDEPEAKTEAIAEDPKPAITEPPDDEALAEEEPEYMEIEEEEPSVTDEENVPGWVAEEAAPTPELAVPFEEEKLPSEVDVHNLAFSHGQAGTYIPSQEIVRNRSLLRAYMASYDDGEASRLPPVTPVTPLPEPTLPPEPAPEPEKRKRGRPPGSKAKVQAGAVPLPDDAPEAEPIAPKPAPEPEPEPAPEKLAAPVAEAPEGFLAEIGSVSSAFADQLAEAIVTAFHKLGFGAAPKALDQGLAKQRTAMKGLRAKVAPLVAPAEPPKRRGRPAKVAAPAPVAAKKPGRPAKAAAPVVEAPKRRGRPPKVQPEAAVVAKPAKAAAKANGHAAPAVKWKSTGVRYEAAKPIRTDSNLGKQYRLMLEGKYTVDQLTKKCAFPDTAKVSGAATVLYNIRTILPKHGVGHKFTEDGIIVPLLPKGVKPESLLR